MELLARRVVSLVRQAPHGMIDLASVRGRLRVGRGDLDRAILAAMRAGLVSVAAYEPRMMPLQQAAELELPCGERVGYLLDRRRAM